MSRKFSFQTVTSFNETTDGTNFGTNMVDVIVWVYLRPFPYNNVGKIEVFHVSGEEIPLKSLNKWEQMQLITEAGAEIESGRYLENVTQISSRNRG